MDSLVKRTNHFLFSVIGTISLFGFSCLAVAIAPLHSLAEDSTSRVTTSRIGDQHFIDILVSTDEIPAGALLSELSSVLKLRMALRKDLGGSVLHNKQDLNGLYAQTTITPRNPIPLSAVSNDIPNSLRQLIPPKMELFTIVLKEGRARNLVLCHRHEPVRLILSRQANLTTERMEQEIIREVAVVSHNLKQPREDINNARPIVVVGLSPLLANQYELLLREKFTVEDIECPRMDRYRH